MPRHRSLRLEHILKGIARIEQLTAGKTVEDYLADEGLREMIERNIARISEAARHVPAGVRAN
ncbi:MAG TPA: HepT-like ribonuclease domain-containing protein [Geminicoccaceae bacterium]|nr:HepT-like ribonuclease domain-containing protein [Geminicoccaceae bacterium]